MNVFLVNDRAINLYLGLILYIYWKGFERGLIETFNTFFLWGETVGKFRDFEKNIRRK